MNTSRTRWAAIGAAVAVTLGAGGIGLVSATSPSGASAYVPIEPCRAADTRAGAENVGPRNTPLGSAETHAVSTGDGDCAGDIPGSATGVQLNVTALGATLPTFLTVWGAGTRPNASSLNPVPGAPPTPNAVTSGLDGDSFNIYNFQGNVNVIVDIVGYYTDHNHDDRYYTEAEIDAELAEIYTKAETDAAIAPKNNVTTAYDDNPDFQNLPADGTDVVVASATVNTVFGYHVVHADLNAFGVAAAPQVRCSIRLGATNTSHVVEAQAITNVGSNQWQNMSFTRRFGVNLAVIGASSTTFNLVCDATTLTFIDNATLTVMTVDDQVPFVFPAP